MDDFTKKSTAFFNSPHNFITLKFHKNFNLNSHSFVLCKQKFCRWWTSMRIMSKNVLAVSMQYIDFHAEGFSNCQSLRYSETKAKAMRKVWC